MRSRLTWIVIAAGLSMSPAMFAQRGQGGAAAPSPTASLPFDPHDFSRIWSRNSQGYGGGGACRGCGDRGFNKDVPPMTPWGQSLLEANKLSYARALGVAVAEQHPEKPIG